MNCGNILKDIRIAKGMKLAEVASQLGRTAGWLQNIEAGRRPLKVRDLEELCRIYGVRADKVIQLAKDQPTRDKQAG